MTVNQAVIDDAVRRALREDLQEGSDITARATVSETAQGTAIMRARKNGVLAGLDCAITAFRMVDSRLTLTAHKKDGDALRPGDSILSVSGPARAILTGERTALNFITHLSGIATLTQSYVQKVAGTNAQITDTRKTLPGLRALEKYAVKMGGGKNHRFGLYDMVLIKDNHIALAGGVGRAIDAARAAGNEKKYDGKIEIEVDTLAQLEEALGHKPDIILLDNMAPALLRQAVAMIDGRAVTEASGGITLDTVRAIAESGVDQISVGALTHSAPALDIGLDIAF